MYHTHIVFSSTTKSFKKGRASCACSKARKKNLNNKADSRRKKEDNGNCNRFTVFTEQAALENTNFSALGNLILISQLTWSRSRRESLHSVTFSQKQGFV